MNDDLIKRLRDLGDHASFEPHMHHAAADRIEQLAATNEELGQQVSLLQAKLDTAVVGLKFHNAAVELCIGDVTPAMREAYIHTKRTIAAILELTE